MPASNYRLIRAIRQKCKQCCNGDIEEVKKCNIKTCALWFFRINSEGLEDTKNKRLLLKGVKYHE